MTPAVIEVLTEVLKNVYLGTVQEQLNQQVLVTQILQLDSKSVDLEGLKAIIALHTGRSSGIGSRDEMDDLPDADHQRYRKAEYDLKYHYGRIAVSGQALQKSKSNVGAFLRAYEAELEGIKNDLALDFARQIYGDGTGIIAEVDDAVSNDKVVPLTTAEPIVKGYLYEGMAIDIGDLSDPSGEAEAAIIDDVDEANATITLTENVTLSGGEFIFRAGNNKSNATKEMDAGLQKLISESPNSVGGLNASTLAVWDNLRVDNTGSDITLFGATGLLSQLNRVTQKGVTFEDLRVLTTPGLMRQLFEKDFKESVRFVDSETMPGGFEKISFSAGAGRVTVVTDRLAPWGKVFMLPTRNIRLFSPGDWDFLAKDGQAIKWVQNKDAFQSILYRYANLGTNRRNNSLVAYGYTDTGV